jgi:hypothetical protein
VYFVIAPKTKPMWMKDENKATKEREIQPRERK